MDTKHLAVTGNLECGGGDDTRCELQRYVFGSQGDSYARTRRNDKIALDGNRHTKGSPSRAAKSTV
jgi:hypothetical protein